MTEANYNLIVRLISAGLIIPVLIMAILWETPTLMAVIVHLCVVIGLIEFYWITLRGDPVWLRIVGVALGLIISLTMFWCPRPDALATGLIAVTFLAMLLHLIHYGELESAVSRTALMVFGILYVSVLLSHVALLKRLPEGSDWIFLVLTVTWFGDTGAYFTGRALGRRRLYPSISPGKSVEGAIGGLVASIGAAELAKLWYMPQLALHDGLVIAIVGGAVGQAGDLVESMIKRSYGVKDSGWIMPGHGGLLDRIDALLFSAPVIYLYAVFISRPMG